MFQISTRLRYGLRALIHLALQPDSGTINLNEISKKEGISRKYLENIFKLLKKDKIIKSERGREGGYALVKKPSEISLHQIAASLEGNVALIDCLNYEELCNKTTDCGVRRFWGDYQDYIKKYLDNITLAEIVKKYSKNRTDCA